MVHSNNDKVQWITFSFYQGFDHFLIWPSLENDVSTEFDQLCSITVIQKPSS